MYMNVCPKQTFFDNIFVIFGRYLEAEGLERTFKFKQRDITDAVDVTSARKVTYCFTCYNLGFQAAVSFSSCP